MPPARAPKLTGQTREVYAILQRGPATEDLLRLSTGSKRVAARVHDLKRWLRYTRAGLEPRSRTDANGCCTYWLEPVA